MRSRYIGDGVAEQAAGLFKASLIEAFGFTRNRESQDNAYADYVSAANGLSKQTRKALQPAKLFPSIPDADSRAQVFRG